MIGLRAGTSCFHRAAAALLAFAVCFSTSGIAFAVEVQPTVDNAGLFTSRTAIPKVDNATGAFTYRVPFDVPPGRNGLSPDVALEYNSQNLADGIAGYGWGLSIPYIERVNTIGSEDLYASSATFRSSLDGELTASTTLSATATTSPTVLDTFPSSSLMHNTENGTSLSFSYTVPSTGVNKLLVVLWTQNHQTAPATLSQNGTSFTSTITRHSESCSPGMANHYFAYLAAPTSGTFSMTWSSNTYSNVAVFTVQDAAQVNAVDVENMTCATASSKSTSVTTTKENDLLLSFTTYAAAAALSSFGSGEAQVTNGSSAGFNSEDYVAWKGAASTPGSETMTSNLDQLANIDHTILAIKRATSTETVSTSIYHARIDDGRFNTYTFENNGWTMYDKNGTRYLFGTSTATRQAATSSPSNVSKWMLEEIRDTNGNYIEYEYTSDENQIYPSKMTYTGNGTTDGPFEIDFTYETRPDTVTSYATAFKVQTKKRLTQVQASIDDSWVRKYVLTYASGVNGARSLLASVTETGRDESGTEASLPGYYFGYSSSTPAYSANSAIPLTASNAYVPADADGNGLPDLSVFDQTSATSQTYWRIDRNTYPSFSHSDTSTTTEYWAVDQSPKERGVRFFDANGDGKADLVKGSKSGAGNYDRAYYQNTYAGSFSWANTTLAEGTIPAFLYDVNGTDKYSTGFLGNVNGDGLIDYVLSMPSAMETIAADNGTYLHAASSTGWTLATSTFSPVAVMATSPLDTQQHYLVDINGDGLDDWMNSASGSTDFCLNTGTSWLASCLTGWTIATTTRGTNGWDKGIRFIDFNADGLLDYVRSYSMPAYTTKCAGNTHIEIGDFNYVYVNTGSGFATTSLTLHAPIFTGQLNGSNQWCGSIEYDELVDWNGDGTPDQEDNASTNSKPDLLTMVRYPAGGSTNVTYQYTSQDAGDNADLAFPLLVVTQLTDKDNRGKEETTTYAYEGGKTYSGGHIKDRRFAGFSSITKTDPFGITKTYSNQANSVDTSSGEQSDGFPLIGRPFREDAQTLSGSTLRKTFKKWNSESYLGGYLVGLISEMIQDFTGDSSHRDKATDYLYASTTNDLIQATEWGEVSGNSDGTFSDSGTDKRKTTISYAASSSVNMSVPTRKTLFDYNNATSSDEKIFYDSLSFGSVNVGNRTKEERLISGSTYASTTKTYNSYGLVATSTDARSNATGYRYDARNLNVGTSTNPLSQATQHLYDYASGKTKLTIDPNGRRIGNTYNGVGRITEVKQSDLATPTTLLTATTFTYTDSTSTPSIVQRSDYLGSTTTVDSYSYFDGLKRLLQERKSTETSNVFAATDIRYKAGNTMGSTSVPYFSSGSTFTEATSTSALYTAYAYDALKRVATTSNIVGTTTNAYSKWTTTFTDALGNVKDYWHDAFGNLANVVEHISASSIATTTYAYDSRNNLATTTDALSNVRAFGYDGLSRRTSAQDLHASGDITFGTWTYSYDDAGNLTSQTDPKSQTVSRTYDALNRMLTEDYTGAAGTEVTNTYDSCGNGVGYLCTASSTSALISNVYDVLGRISISTTTISGTAYPASYTYSRRGDVTNMTYPDLSQVANGYNIAGLLDRVELKPAGGSFSDIANFNYAAHGFPSFTLFGNGASTTRSYDERALYRLSRLLTGTSTPLQDASYTYDANGNILNISHPTSTSFTSVLHTYDALNRLLTASTTATTSSPYLHSYSYDVLGSLLSLTSGTSSTVSSNSPTILDSIPSASLMHNTENGTSLSFSYTVPSGGSNKLLVVLFGDNSGGVGPTAISQNGVDFTSSMVHQTQSCLPGMKHHYFAYLANPSSGTFSMTWSGSTYSNVAVFTVKDAAQSSPIDDENLTCATANTKTTSATTTQGNDLLLSYTAYQSQGAVTSFGSGEAEVSNGSSAGFNSEDYVAWKAAATTAGTETMTTNLDSTRNIDLSVIAIKAASTAATSTSPTIISYAYAGTGYANPHAVTQTSNGVSTTTYAYDNNGNLIQKILSSGGTSTTTLHVWDYANRLTQTAIGNTSTTTTTYGYDAFGMRVFMGVNGATTTYPSKYFSRIFSTTGATTTATTTSYIFSGDTLLATFEGAASASTTRYSHPDHLGSTALVTNSAGTSTLQTLEYFPYGSERTNTGSQATTKTYIGLYSDDATDLLYANARYYNPTQGQFLSQDPTFLALGNPNELQRLTHLDQGRILSDPQMQHSYGYARDNPISNSDPTGLIINKQQIETALTIYENIQRGKFGIDAVNYYFSGNLSSEEKAARQAQLVRDGTLIVGGVGAGVAGGVVLAAGEMALMGIEKYCASNTCHDLHTTDESPQDIVKKIVSGEKIQMTTATAGSKQLGTESTTFLRTQVNNSAQRVNSFVAAQISAIQGKINALREQINALSAKIRAGSNKAQ